ncbi:MAG: hypothetical protein ACPIOQ_46990, partial [Promethearchaeia archaeon]
VCVFMCVCMVCARACTYALDHDLHSCLSQARTRGAKLGEVPTEASPPLRTAARLRLLACCCKIGALPPG